VGGIMAASISPATLIHVPKEPRKLAVVR